VLSIIISSYQEGFYNALEKNIAETIGIPYEIIKIHNPKLIGICDAYNRGIADANYDYLLCVHEDVLFHTENWGVTLVNIFEKDTNIGLIGIAGATEKSKFPSAFWHTEKEKIFISVIQHYNNGSRKHYSTNNFTSPEHEVAVIDGVFIALKKSNNIFFNDEIKGFHCYDLGISIDSFSNGLKVVVTNQILLEHFSIGKTDKEFIYRCIDFHQLYRSKLPIQTDENFPKETIAKEKFLHLCLENRIIPYKLWLSYLILNPWNKINFYFMKIIFVNFKRRLNG
jgi:hypothetical protein